MTASHNHRREDYKLTTRDVASIFFYTRKTFVLAFVGVIVGALLVALLSPPVYKVHARLVVKPRIEKPLLFDSGNSNVSLLDKVEQQTLNTVVYLLKSSDVVSEVVRKHNLADSGDETEILKETGALMGRIKAEPLSLSNIIEVELKGGDPIDITEQMNTLLDSYIEYHIKVNQEYSGSLNFFEQQAELYKNRYNELTNRVADARKRLNLANPEIQADNNLNVVRDLEIRRAQLVSEMKAEGLRISQLQSAANNVGDEALASLPQAVRETYPALIEMERTLAQLIINVRRARSDFKGGSKPVLDAELQYENMRRQISVYILNVVKSLRIGQESIQEEISALDDQINASRATVGQISSNAVLLQRIEFERDLAEKNYRLYEAKREEARINSEKDRSLFANVSIASRPQTPASPWFPRRGLIMMLAIPLAFIVAIAASIIAYSLDHTVRNPTDVHLRTRLRLLGTLDAV